jgi:hypothetical protein
MASNLLVLQGLLEIFPVCRAWLAQYLIISMHFIALGCVMLVIIVPSIQPLVLRKNVQLAGMVQVKA